MAKTGTAPKTREAAGARKSSGSRKSAPAKSSAKGKKPQPIHAIRIIPPMAIARFGSSPQPLENYKLDPAPFEKNFEDDDGDYRKIIPSHTLEVDTKTGAISDIYTPGKNGRPEFSFRDSRRRIKPVCPFFEVWFQPKAGAPFEPLTLEHLASHGLGPQDVSWSVEAANLKAFRRTGDKRDKVHGELCGFSDHEPHPLMGGCPNFKPGKHLPFGSFRYIKPVIDEKDTEHRFEKSQIRARFTPGEGLVFGPGSVHDTARTDGDVYHGFTSEPRDPTSPGRWDRYFVLDDCQYEAAGADAPPPRTAPYDIFQGEWIGLDTQLLGQTVFGNTKLSHGYFDDTCDGIVTVSIAFKDRELAPAYARFASSVPDFAPDSLPTRSIADDIEQMALGVKPDGLTDKELAEDVVDIVRRALDTMQQMNTRAMNGDQEGWDYTPNTRNMAWKHQGRGRKFKEIFGKDGAEYEDVYDRHKGLVSEVVGDGGQAGPLFVARTRKPDEVGDLREGKRRNMPAMMRGSESLEVALTWRMYNKLKRSASKEAGEAFIAEAPEAVPEDTGEEDNKYTAGSLRQYLRSDID